MAEQVKLIECPRDAWQGLAGQVPANVKAAYLRVLIESGFRHIDAVSFVSPKAVPQMADSEEVLGLLEDVSPDVELIGIVVNEKGAERAAAVPEQIATLGFPYSISPTFLERNQNQSLEEALFDALTVAWARGVYDASPDGTVLRWVPVTEGRCADCDDNSLEPTVKGSSFPTGQSYPPAHPGCRCMLAPVEILSRLAASA